MGASATEAKKGPQKADQNKYLEVAQKQTAAAMEAIQSQPSTFAAGLGQSAAYSGNQGQAKLQSQLEKMGLANNLVTPQVA